MRALHLSLAFLSMTACASAPTTKPTTKPTTTTTTKRAAASARLFSLDLDDGQCHGRIRTLGDAPSTQTLFSTASTCPTSIIIDGPRARVLGVHDGHVVSWSSDGTRTVLGPLPTPAGAPSHPPELRVLATGAVQVAQVVIDGVTVIEGTPQKLRFEGKDMAITDDMAFPPWGIAAVVVLSEHTGTGWKRLELAPTKTDAGDTLGSRALATPTTPPVGVVVIAELQRAMTCVGSLRCDNDDAALIAAVRTNRSARDGDVEAVGQLEHGGAVYAWATQWGDTPHAVAPLYRCTDKSCSSKTIVDDRKETRQLAIASSGDFVLVAAEYENNLAIVLDRHGRAQPLVPALSTSVVFLP